ncbi:MAG: hypothetical protein WAX04_11395 [Oscillospiraceae bacterium]
MDDLMSKLQGILSTKEGQEQLKNITSMLNNSGNKQAESPPPQNNGFDLSSLANMFSSMGGASAPQQPEKMADNNNGNNNNSGFDMSSIMSMLSGLGGGASGGANGATANDTANAMPNIDINMIMKLQQVFSSMNVSDKNSQLLLALKPHFSEQRSKKVDQAISMMRLFSMMPMLKESGIFAGL